MASASLGPAGRMRTPLTRRPCVISSTASHECRRKSRSHGHGRPEPAGSANAPCRGDRTLLPIRKREPDLSLRLQSGNHLWLGSNSSRSEEHTSELQSRENLVCRLLLEKKNY